MKKVFIFVVLLILSAPTFSQQPTRESDLKAKAKQASDPLLLSEAEQRELNEALNFVGQAKKEYDLALDDALSVPIERMNALEVVGRLQKANTIVKAANQHFTDLRETHKARRPDCEKCEYAPDLKSLVRPPAEGKGSHHD